VGLEHPEDPHPLTTCSSPSAEMVRRVSRLSESFRLEAFLFSVLTLLIFAPPGFVERQLICWRAPACARTTPPAGSNTSFQRLIESGTDGSRSSPANPTGWRRRRMRAACTKGSRVYRKLLTFVPVAPQCCHAAGRYWLELARGDGGTPKHRLCVRVRCLHTGRPVLTGSFNHETNQGDCVLVVDHTRGTCPKSRRSFRGRKDPLGAEPDGGYSSNLP